ncbi:hypothetical protein BDF20DRAFT_863348 [Mycotypha africana]|uniref:uncharacterized protein n=1 Tax=Mycotypha africana TaxID=64632 RepID=UPI0023006953|nr:uncharacterized protein BDF20DRAFT_863348 [Mycotypha africana]KAI8981807.1 hypothetical protein BDF20DRAFT_863348 [Mycotypha africana]
MARSAIFISAILAMTALVSAAPYHHDHHDHHRHHDHHDSEYHTGGNVGAINFNPGHHGIIDDITIKNSLNHLIDLDILTLKNVANNIDILSHNG